MTLLSKTAMLAVKKKGGDEKALLGAKRMGKERREEESCFVAGESYFRGTFIGSQSFPLTAPHVVRRCFF